VLHPRQLSFIHFSTTPPPPRGGPLYMRYLGKPHLSGMHAGPEIGPIQSLMVVPEVGSWRLEEATVSSSRSKNTSR